jgi:hypothetical protein
MDRPVLIIEMPDLTYAQAAGIEEFLHALIKAFESHYHQQLREYYRQLQIDALMNEIIDDDVIDDLF